MNSLRGRYGTENIVEWWGSIVALVASISGFRQLLHFACDVSNLLQLLNRVAFGLPKIAKGPENMADKIERLSFVSANDSLHTIGSR